MSLKQKKPKQNNTMRTKKQLTEAQRKSAAEARKQAMAELRKLYKDYSEKMTPEQRAAIEEAANRLDGYTLHNKILIVLQCGARGICPSAVSAASLWKQAGRKIRKGEKAIRILAPIVAKRGVQPEDGAIVPYGYIFEETEKSNSRVWFKPVPVFDVSQTDPAPAELPDETMHAPEKGTVTILDAEEPTPHEFRAVSPQRERVKREPVAAEPAGDLFGWARIA